MVDKNLTMKRMITIMFLRRVPCILPRVWAPTAGAAFSSETGMQEDQRHAGQAWQQLPFEGPGSGWGLPRCELRPSQQSSLVALFPF